MLLSSSTKKIIMLSEAHFECFKLTCITFNDLFCWSRLRTRHLDYLELACFVDFEIVMGISSLRNLDPRLSNTKPWLKVSFTKTLDTFPVDEEYVALTVLLFLLFYDIGIVGFWYSRQIKSMLGMSLAGIRQRLVPSYSNPNLATLSSPRKSFEKRSSQSITLFARNTKDESNQERCVLSSLSKWCITILA